MEKCRDCKCVPWRETGSFVKLQLQVLPSTVLVQKYGRAFSGGGFFSNGLKMENVLSLLLLQKSAKERDYRSQLGFSQVGLVCDSAQVLAQHLACNVTWTEESGRAGFTSLLSHSVAGWPCGCYLTSLGLFPFLCKIRMITGLAS